MSRKITIVLFISMFFAVSAFAYELPELDIKVPVFKPTVYFAVAVPGEEVIPDGIANNKFYLESLKYNRLAMEMYEIGDYDASAGFAQDAIRYAELSDEYVSAQLIIEAERLIAWADKNNIATRFPNNYNEGINQYDIAKASYSNEEWNDSIIAAIKAIEIFAAFESGRPVTTTTTASSRTGLPRQYTVRTWRVERDCLWTIAGYPWVYNDPWKWRELYEANKNKMPEPGNPDLIEPGMVLEIPSIQGETRQGMWRP